MKKLIILGLMLISLVFLFGCTQPAPAQKEYVCSNGQVVLNPANCPAEPTYQEEEKINCEIEYGSKYSSGIKVKDITCTDEIGTYWAQSGSHCDWDNIDSTVPGQSHRSSKIVKDSVRCENNRCVVDSYVVKDCSKYDTASETALCGDDSVSDLPVCSLYANDGSYYKPLD